jgi:hypothetical protein
MNPLILEMEKWPHVDLVCSLMNNLQKLGTPNIVQNNIISAISNCLNNTPSIFWYKVYSFLRKIPEYKVYGEIVGFFYII